MTKERVPSCSTELVTKPHRGRGLTTRVHSNQLVKAGPVENKPIWDQAKTFTQNRLKTNVMIVNITF